MDTKCAYCKRQFKDNDNIVPILKYIKNEKRGDFTTNFANKFVHYHHLIPTALF